MFYGPPKDGRYPESAVKLVEKVAMYSGSTTENAKATTDTIRKKLAESSVQLSKILSDDWRKYLALPAEVYGSDKHPSVDSLKSIHGRFDKVAKDDSHNLR